MAKIEKREDGWYAEGSGPFGSRDAARQAVRKADQDEAFDTYAENVAVSEALVTAETDVTEVDGGTVIRTDGMNEPVFVPFADELEQVREAKVRENWLYMATHTDGPAKRFWLRKITEAGWAHYLDDEFVTQATS